MHDRQTICVGNLAVRKKLLRLPPKNLCCGIQIGRDGCWKASGGLCGEVLVDFYRFEGWINEVWLFSFFVANCFVSVTNQVRVIFCEIRVHQRNWGCVVVVGLCRMQVQRTLVPPASFFISFHSSLMRHQKNIFYPFVDTSKQTYQSLANKSISYTFRKKSP